LDDDADDEQSGPKRKGGVLSRLLRDVIKTNSSKHPTNLKMIIRSEIQCYCHDMIADLNDDPLK